MSCWRAAVLGPLVEGVAGSGPCRLSCPRSRGWGGVLASPAVPVGLPVSSLSVLSPPLGCGWVGVCSAEDAPRDGVCGSAPGAIERDAHTHARCLSSPVCRARPSLPSKLPRPRRSRSLVTLRGGFCLTHCQPLSGSWGTGLPPWPTLCDKATCGKVSCLTVRDPEGQERRRKCPSESSPHQEVRTAKVKGTYSG